MDGRERDDGACGDIACYFWDISYGSYVASICVCEMAEDEPLVVSGEHVRDLERISAG